MLLGLVAVFALIGANAFFVAAEFALVGARKTRLDEMARDGDRKAMLAARVHQSLGRYISATQIGITLCSLGLGWFGEPVLSGIVLRAFRAFPARIGPVETETIATVISFGLITYTLIIIGELLPKALALRYPELMASWMAGPLIAFAWVMAVPIRIVSSTANWLLKLMGIKATGSHERLHSPEEIRMLVEQSQEGGQLGKQDARLLEGVFEFTEKTAQDVMTPRTEIVALEAGLTVEQAADIVAAAGRSRYPVHLDSLDDIIGIVHAKDLLRVLRTTPDAPVRSVVRPPLLVPSTREVEDVLADMKRLKVHMAIVIDEYGGTAGLVTMEDLLEEIVGPIFDEHDAVERVAAAGAAPLLDGAMPISAFNAAHDASLDDTDYTTLGGYLFGQLGRLPQPGDRVTAGDHVFEIVAMEGRRVKKISALGTRRSALGEGVRDDSGGRPG